MPTIASTCRRRSPPTGCGASGSPRTRRRATTTDLPTRASGRCATTRTCVPPSARATSSTIAPINARFADAVVAEARTDDPIVLVQDYHFALLPRMIRDRLPKATVITFWHIPWPNPESFAHLPVARRAARWPARQQHPGVPHAVPLQQLPRHRGPRARGAGRPGGLRGHAAGPVHAGPSLSDLDRVAAGIAGAHRRCRRLPARSA